MRGQRTLKSGKASLEMCDELGDERQIEYKSKVTGGVTKLTTWEREKREKPALSAWDFDDDRSKGEKDEWERTMEACWDCHGEEICERNGDKAMFHFSHARRSRLAEKVHYIIALDESGSMTDPADANDKQGWEPGATGWTQASLKGTKFARAMEQAQEATRRLEGFTCGGEGQRHVPPRPRKNREGKLVKPQDIHISLVLFHDRARTLAQEVAPRAATDLLSAALPTNLSELKNAKCAQRGLGLGGRNEITASLRQITEVLRDQPTGGLLRGSEAATPRMRAKLLEVLGEAARNSLLVDASQGEAGEQMFHLRDLGPEVDPRRRTLRNDGRDAQLGWVNVL
jgi:hypothetical protein